MTFDQPTNPEIKNASHSTLYSGSYETLSRMAADVDARLTEVKIALHRRRED